MPIAFTTLFLVASPLNAEQNGANKLGLVHQCQVMTARLERLDCFDTLFPPQLPPRVKRSEVEYPWQWEMAFEGRASTSDAESSLEEKDKWVTLVAASESEDVAPVLIMSCINNISRVELTFPQAVQDGRITVSVAGGPQQSWRSDDTGLLFSSAQGLPAISMMKAMAKQSRLVLRSNSTAADSLRFDGSTLNEDLVPLREECGW
ncbi:type VI secretion system-associated protein VasI [Vibrio aquaticus]|uniref:type VI secretion system-associated protein VasI n=1 Tax=Vibrio aquaticus TaxID=2496559 RepID=UPI001319CFDA|nr:type VI secretion system-associated protein VasI [Vibrio aquaticus]